VATQETQPQPEQEASRPKPVEKFQTKITQGASRFLKKWIALPLLGALISVMIIGRLINWVVGPSSYKIYVVGNLSDPESKGIADAFSGDLPTINGTSVGIKELDDSGDPDTAEKISLRLASMDDTLFVVGHLESTPTQKALPAYLQVADPPIPVILTTETNPNLLPKNVDGRYQPVFRLSPTDTDQAQKAADFIVAKGATAIWVVEDMANPVYSGYLAREFIRRVHTHQSAKVLLWSTNYNIPPAYAVSDLGINWVFFAGQWQNALVLIRQLRVIPKTRQVNVLLSDWCVDGSLLEDGGGDIENVYLSHALTSNIYNQGQYTVYGRDSFQVVRQLLLDGDQHFDQLAGQDNKLGYALHRLLGLRRVSDARRVISHEMESAALHAQMFNLSNGGRAIFDGSSNRRDATFHIWQIRNGKFTDTNP
jgi:hypothetical protein